MIFWWERERVEDDVILHLRERRVLLAGGVRYISPLDGRLEGGVPPGPWRTLAGWWLEGGVLLVESVEFVRGGGQ